MAGRRSCRSASTVFVADIHQTAELLPENETCCLLRDTNDSVRGFLALARREAESGWSVLTPRVDQPLIQ